MALLSSSTIVERRPSARTRPSQFARGTQLTFAQGTHSDVYVDEHQLRVLVVDDFPDTADVMELYLTRAGYEVRSAYCGADAIRVARWFQPDLAIIDIRLPDMTGYDVARRLRADAGDHPLRLVALSGDADPDLALEARFDEVVCKPVSGPELHRLIREPLELLVELCE